MKRKMILIPGIAAVAVLSGLAVTVRRIGWGPFSFLHSWEEEVKKIEERYPAEERRGEIVFYGASNFRLWKDMEEDLKGFAVQNHGFGGSTDKLLVRYADRLLYPYKPKIVFFQTGSNDLTQMAGTDEEKVAACMGYKKQMYETFHRRLPEAKFVVMSGLLLPGRSQYTKITQRINEELKRYCEEKEYMYFVDSSEMTYIDGKYREDLFIKDGIHLNHEGQLLWRDTYIQPMIERLIGEYGQDRLRK